MKEEHILYFIKIKCRFQYESYNHKQALAEYNSKKENTEWFYQNPNSWDMPEDLKEKYKEFKIGKLRSIEISPIGLMWRFKIGNKYSKNYVLNDFGIKVKPILSKKQDKFKFIEKGFAILTLKNKTNYGEEKCT